MFEITLKEYNAIPKDYTGVWSTERTDYKGCIFVNSACVIKLCRMMEVTSFNVIDN